VMLMVRFSARGITSYAKAKTTEAITRTRLPGMPWAAKFNFHEKENKPVAGESLNDRFAKVSANTRKMLADPAAQTRMKQLLLERAERGMMLGEKPQDAPKLAKAIANDTILANAMTLTALRSGGPKTAADFLHQKGRHHQIFKGMLFAAAQAVGTTEKERIALHEAASKRYAENTPEGRAAIARLKAQL